MTALTATASLHGHDGAGTWSVLTRIQAAGRPVLAVALCVTALSATWMLPTGLENSGKIALSVTALAIIGWTLTAVPDSVVAVSAALVLVLTGVVPETQLYATLGREIVWLLVAAFVIAAVVRSSGLMERLAFAAVRPFRSLPGFFHALALVISLTAFLIPSTSGRAALLLPVFMALADQMPGKAFGTRPRIAFPDRDFAFCRWLDYWRRGPHDHCRIHQSGDRHLDRLRRMAHAGFPVNTAFQPYCRCAHPCLVRAAR